MSNKHDGHKHRGNANDQVKARQKHEPAPKGDKRTGKTPEGLPWPDDTNPVEYYALTGFLGFVPRGDGRDGGPRTPGLGVSFDEYEYNVVLNPKVDKDARLIACLDHLIETDEDLEGNYTGVARNIKLARIDKAGRPPFANYEVVSDDADRLLDRVREMGLDAEAILHYERNTENRSKIVKGLEEIIEEGPDDHGNGEVVI